jgi:hypothetical protein
MKNFIFALGMVALAACATNHSEYERGMADAQKQIEQKKEDLGEQLARVRETATDEAATQMAVYKEQLKHSADEALTAVKAQAELEYNKLKNCLADTKACRKQK